MIAAQLTRVLLLATIVAPSEARAGEQARFVPLGQLDSGTFSFAYDLNADGSVVVGRASNATPDTAVRWQVLNGHEVFVHSGPFAEPTSQLAALSADGSIVFGEIFQIEYSTAFRVDAGGEWTLFGLGGGYNNLAGASADGSVIALSTDDTFGGSAAFIGSPETGFTDVGSLPGGSPGATAFGLSSNGLALVGEAGSSGGFQAYRWSADRGMLALGFLTGATGASRAMDASRNGSVVVGRSRNRDAQYEAFRWTEDAGMVALGVLPGAQSSFGTSVSDDGRVVVGTSGGAPFIWFASSGMLPLQEHLFELGASCLEGWTLTSATLSADGNAVAGTGTNPAGMQEAYVAYLRAPDRYPPSVPAVESVRLGSPPNPDALLPGQSSPPYVGAQWDPVVDHTGFAADAMLDVLVMGAKAVEISLGTSGTLLCSPPFSASTALAGERFAVQVPNLCALIGASICAQSVSLFEDGSPALLTNALDLTLGAL